MAIYRVALQGGVPQQLFDTHGFVQFWCTNRAANFCVFGRPTEDKNELVVAAFDPFGGPGKELVRIPLEPGSSADMGFDYTWQLSPDGSWIGIVKRYGNQIRLVPLAGGQTITIKGYSDLLDPQLGDRFPEYVCIHAATRRRHLVAHWPQRRGPADLAATSVALRMGYSVA
jgi:hypothetical protein